MSKEALIEALEPVQKDTQSLINKLSEEFHGAPSVQVLEQEGAFLKSLLDALSKESESDLGLVQKYYTQTTSFFLYLFHSLRRSLNFTQSKKNSHSVDYYRLFSQS